ncbi:MAG: methyltransferase domain-containing protein [Alphaproteobacteria bacterium]|jgi:cyclopropane-fatty-acyl-phospholipid synthase|nr:methyltransferase domain-containing protein [Alphaproteobacteria bacterium]
MWKSTLDRLLARLVVEGRLTVTWADGSVSAFGRESNVVAPARMHLVDPGHYRALCLRPVMAFGEGYMDGQIEVAPDGLYDLVALFTRNMHGRGRMPGWFRAVQGLRQRLNRFVQRNDPRRARRNVAHHYDLSDDLYRLFLDEDMQYSCAYFARPDMTLEEAQAAKKAHIAAKLRLQPGCRVLDIGCGWGGLALTLARDHGARVTGVTLSENQLATARRRAEAAGLSDRVAFRLMDYRKLNKSFDRIVSVGMLEHVGLPQFDTYFSKVHDLLAPDGVALIHTIGQVAPPRPTSDWLEKYIFPGGYVPSLSELVPPIERSGLWATDIEVLRGHYGPTLNHWRQRFEAALPQVRAMNDERFIRMWRFYLVACEATFEQARQGVFQMQLSHAQYAVPVTRDYLYPPPEARTHAAQ